MLLDIESEPHTSCLSYYYSFFSLGTVLGALSHDQARPVLVHLMSYRAPTLASHQTLIVIYKCLHMILPRWLSHSLPYMLHTIPLSFIQQTTALRQVRWLPQVLNLISLNL